MAIFGSFSDMPLPDVLSVVGRSTGRFLVWNHPTGKTYELWMETGCVSGLFVDGNPIWDEMHARSFLVGLINSETGEFEFKRGAVEPSGASFRLRIDEILLSSLSAIDELESVRSHLPDPSTRFIFVPGASALLEGDVLRLWNMARDALISGTSGEELASQFELPMDHLLLQLYKLRSAGLIEPVRAWAPTVAPEAEPEPAPQEETPLPFLDSLPGLEAGDELATVAASLRPIWEEPPAPVHAEKLTPPPSQENHEAAQASVNGHKGRLAGVKAYTPPPTFMGRLFGSFQSLFKK